MEKLSNEKFNKAIIVIAFVFNIVVFAPLELFYTNKKEFWFNVNDILPVIILLLGILLVLSVFIFYFPFI